MNILTDEDIVSACNATGSTALLNKIARAIEAAVLSKLAEQDVEPSCWMTPDGEGWRMRTSPPVNDVPLGWMAMYQETQLLAVQQRTAEACAKAVFEQAKYFGYNVHAEAVRDAALNNWGNTCEQRYQ